MTQAVEVLPSLALAPHITMCPHTLHLDLLHLSITHCQVLTLLYQVTGDSNSVTGTGTQ